MRHIGQCRLRPLPKTPDGECWPSTSARWGAGPAGVQACRQAGVVDHGLFPPELVTEVLVGTDGKVDASAVHEPGRVACGRPRDCRSRDGCPQDCGDGNARRPHLTYHSSVVQAMAEHQPKAGSSS